MKLNKVKLNKEQKERVTRFVEALRSGQYQQGRSSLHPRENTFCCLGVACDVFRKETGTGEWQGGTFVIGDERHDSVLPSAVSEYFFNDPYRCIPNLGKGTAVDYNDRQFETFEEIANRFEDKYLKD